MADMKKVVADVRAELMAADEELKKKRELLTIAQRNLQVAEERYLRLKQMDASGGQLSEVTPDQRDERQRTLDSIGFAPGVGH